MNKLVIVLAMLFVVGCGSEAPQPTCSEFMGSFYASGCSMWDISVSPPEEWTLSEAIYWCREVVDYVHDYCGSCVGKLNTWLSCDIEYQQCGVCNDEQERMLACCE